MNNKRRYIVSFLGLGGVMALLGLLLKKNGEIINANSPLIEIPFPNNPTDIRRIIIANALSCIGLGASNHRQAFETILGPPPKGWKWDLDRPFIVNKQGVSTCGLVGEGFQRRAGSLCSSLNRPYVDGTTISRFIQCAINWGAWVPGSSPLPKPGDYTVIGTGYGTHVLTLMAWSGSTAHSVDGGQVNEIGLQKIGVKSRQFAGGALDGRAIYGHVDCTKCKYGPTAIVPKGWKSVEVPL